MIIYIAELNPMGIGRNPNTIPLAAGFLAAFVKKSVHNLKITIFRDPDLLLRLVK